MVGLLDIFELDSGTFATVLELCEGNDLDLHLQRHQVCFTTLAAVPTCRLTNPQSRVPHRRFTRTCLGGTKPLFVVCEAKHTATHDVMVRLVCQLDAALLLRALTIGASQLEP